MDFLSNYSQIPSITDTSKIKQTQTKILYNCTQITVKQLAKLQLVLSNEFRQYDLKFINIDLNEQKKKQSSQSKQKIQSKSTISSIISSKMTTKQQIKSSQIQAQNILNFSFLTKGPIKNYQILIQFKLNLNTASYTFTSKILTNYKILKSSSKSFIKILSRYFMNCNAKFNQGSFYIDPIDWTINLILENHTTIDRITQILSNPLKFLIIVKTNIYTIKQRLNQQFLSTLLYLLNKPYKSNKRIQIIKNKINKLNNSVLKSHFQIKQQYSESIVMRFKPLQKQQRKQKYYRNYNEQKRFQKNQKDILITPILQLYLGKQKINKSTYKYIEMQKKQISQHIQNLNCAQFTTKYTIYTEIQILKNHQQVCIFESGFSKVYAIDAQFQRQTDKIPTHTRLILKKPCERRYQNQIFILKQIKDSRCLFIPRYYYSQQRQYTKTIIMQYIPQSTIQRYITSKQKYISLMTKTFFLFEIIVALRFLRDHNIVHIDLKPQNILIKIVSDSQNQQQHYIVKLIDFGESFYSKKKDDQSARGHTIPYASPQLLLQKPTFDQKTDVFSIGVIMYQLLFQHFSYEALAKGKQIFKDQTYLRYFSMPFQQFNQHTLNDLSFLLYYLCHKCLKYDPKQRPTLDWLCLIIKEIVLIFQQITK